MNKRIFPALLLAVTAASCENGGAGRTVGVTATGVVLGQVYFDANASGSLDASDAGLAGARISVLASGGTTDTIARAVTAADGTFRIGSVPVGSHRVVLDSSSVGDSVVVAATTGLVTVTPLDSVSVVRSVSFPVRTVAEARALPPGTRLFVRGVALHARETFSDTVIHVVDATGALRATRVRPSTIAAAAGDSVVLRGRVGTRLGQRTIDDVTVFVLGQTFIPTAPTITTAVAALGSAGTLDAAVVRVNNVLVTDTSTVAGDRWMTVTDGTGAVTVILDRAADAGFRVPFPVGLYVPGTRFDIIGVLVPTGAGAWRLKPRSALDLTVR